MFLKQGWPKTNMCIQLDRDSFYTITLLFFEMEWKSKQDELVYIKINHLNSKLWLSVKFKTLIYSTKLLMLFLTESMCFGTSSPVASTGISSYLLKLMPVLPTPNSSTSRRSSLAVGVVQSFSRGDCQRSLV